MPLSDFQNVVQTTTELREVLGEPSAISQRKVLHQLDQHMRQLIAVSPFLILATSSKSGQCDASPRGDAPGFVTVADDSTVLIPERAGNKRADSLQNIIDTGLCGILFLVPGFGETLRINGAAKVIRDAAWLERMTVQGKTPQLAIAVEIHECFLQCAKATIRSHLWDPNLWASLSTLPTAGKMLADHVRLPEYDPQSMQQLLDSAYECKLY